MSFKISKSRNYNPQPYWFTISKKYTMSSLNKKEGLNTSFWSVLIFILYLPYYMTFESRYFLSWYSLYTTVYEWIYSKIHTHQTTGADYSQHTLGERKRPFYSLLVHVWYGRYWSWRCRAWVSEMLGMFFWTILLPYCFTIQTVCMLLPNNTPIFSLTFSR